MSVILPGLWIVAKGTEHGSPGVKKLCQQCHGLVFGSPILVDWIGLLNLVRHKRGIMKMTFSGDRADFQSSSCQLTKACALGNENWVTGANERQVNFFVLVEHTRPFDTQTLVDTLKEQLTPNTFGKVSIKNMGTISSRRNVIRWIVKSSWLRQESQSS